MRDETNHALTQQLGKPSTSTDKVLRWHVKPGLDVVVQRDAAGSRGIVWVPWPSGDGVCPSNGEVYAAGRGRHSNTYGAPSLRRGQAALKLTVRTSVDLASVIARLQSAVVNGHDAVAEMAAPVVPARLLAPRGSRRDGSRPTERRTWRSGLSRRRALSP
jgi:hypothetical protein